ncbi:hypothetical protein KM043_015043 [Ampulex compressa]|nr:hypothetical protein KM043_015043 [Ampulex compressa]
MIINKKLNQIIQSCRDEGEDADQTIFSTPVAYNNKVKIHDWQMQGLAEPRDNADIFPPKGDLHKSSYRRLGPEEACTGISETQAMLSQIELKDRYNPIYPRRALLQMQIYESMCKEKKPKDLKLTDVLLDPEETRCMDYRTTMERDYRLPYPIKPKPPPPPPPPEPWLLNRRSIGYSLHDLEKREGINTFLDDNMQLHRKIADLKMRRKNAWKLTLEERRGPIFDGTSTANETHISACHS